MSPQVFIHPLEKARGLLTLLLLSLCSLRGDIVSTGTKVSTRQRAFLQCVRSKQCSLFIGVGVCIRRHLGTDQRRIRDSKELGRLG